jgi:hypothetical protein
MGDITLELYWKHAPKVSISDLRATDADPRVLSVYHLDLQELCGTGEKRLLQWGFIPSHHT